jgi:hypothetical protein
MRSHICSRLSPLLEWVLYASDSTGSSTKARQHFSTGRDGKKLKSIDSAYVVEFILLRVGSSGKFTFQVDMEIKLPIAAKAFGAQIRTFNIPFREADRLEFLTEEDSARSIDRK